MRAFLSVLRSVSICFSVFCGIVDEGEGYFCPLPPCDSRAHSPLLLGSIVDAMSPTFAMISMRGQACLFICCGFPLDPDFEMTQSRD